MKAGEIGARYATALYQLAAENNQQDQIFNELRVFNEALTHDKSIVEFLSSPVITPAEKEKAFANAFKSLKVSELIKQFVYLLAKKQRLDIFGAIVEGYQAIADEKHGVVRGVVRSASVLAPEERKRVEETVNRVTKRQSILLYKEDPTLLGGLLAQVGSYTFDDSLSSHLRRMNEQLSNRGNI